METPTLTPVTSSNIAAIGHDGDHLFVQFHSGAIYRYRSVPASHHEAMLSAESVGKYLHQHIKLGGYDYERIS